MPEAGLGQDLVAAVGAVGTHSRPGQEDGGLGGAGDGGAKGGGCAEPGRQHSFLPLFGRRPVRDGLTGQVHDDVGRVDDCLVDAHRCGDPSADASRLVVRFPDQPDDLVPVGSQVVVERPAEESRRTPDDDLSQRSAQFAFEGPAWRRCLIAVRKRPASAPSTTRWSYVSAR